MNILVTGAAGFIGSNLCLRLLKDQPLNTIIGVDSVNDHYTGSYITYIKRELTS